MKIKGYRRILGSQSIKAMTRRLGRELTKKYKGKDVLAVCVLNGGVYFFVDLTRAINLPLVTDSIAVESYANNSQSSSFRVNSQMKHDVKGKDVLLIDDVYDTGDTLEKLKALLLEKGAKSVVTVAFAIKCETKEPDYYCAKFSKRDFLVGYGLDYDEKYRNLYEIGVIEETEK